jgi:predicted Holliday junction resolvase-like endonuclease
MLSLLTNWRIYLLAVFLASAIINALQQYKINSLEENYQICQSNAAAQKVAIALAQEMREKHLRLREQEAAERARQSLKRRDEIMDAQVPEDCLGAVRWAIDQAH